MTRLWVAPFALACRESADESVPLPSDTDTGHTEPIAPAVPEDCADVAPLPASFDPIGRFTHAEDFVLDGDGYLVSVDENGTLVGIDQAGGLKVILPGVGTSTSGMHLLPNGDFVFSDARTGTVMRVSPSGASSAVLSGLSYPNGIEVDLEGYLYVTEHDGGRVRRVDPDSGSFEVIASDLYHPNGIQFGVDYETLYIGSFGEGTIRALDRLPDGTWSEPRLLGSVPGIDLDAIPDPCEGEAEGAACFDIHGGLGTCTAEDGATLGCEIQVDTAACAGLTAGDPCTTEFVGTGVESLCVEDALIADGPYCPRIDAERLEACEGVYAYDTCRVDSGSGYCAPSWEGPLACSLISDFDAWNGYCDGIAIGAPCAALDPVMPYEGTCQDYSDWGYGVICEPWFGFGTEGGLDGIAVDACENVYATEYVSGKIWRFSPDGTPVEEVATTGGYWIPNMHWGNGVGGWDPEVLYVIDRESTEVIGLQLGVHGVPESYQPHPG